MADLVLRANGKDVSFQVTSASVLTGNLHAATVFNQVRPLRPNFFLRGDRSLIGKVEHAAPGSHLRIQGHWRSGTRDLMVSSIEASPAHPAAAGGVVAPPLLPPSPGGAGSWALPVGSGAGHHGRGAVRAPGTAPGDGNQHRHAPGVLGVLGMRVHQVTLLEADG